MYRLPASVIQDHLVELDYYCRVGWVGWREVAVSVDSLVYRSSAGGSWRRGRARRNAALQRHVHEALMQKAILAVVVGRRRKGAIAVSRRATCSCVELFGNGFRGIVLSKPVTHSYNYPLVLSPPTFFLSFFLCLFFPLYLCSIFVLSACPPPPPVPRITSSQVPAV